VQRVAITVEFHGRAAAPAGDPLQTNPQAASFSLKASSADGSPFEIEHASYSNHAIYTGETTFTETGTISFGDTGDEFDIDTVGEGTLGPSADPELLHGAVMYRVTSGRGRFHSASGLITSNFLLRPATGEFEEQQVAIVFLP